MKRILIFAAMAATLFFVSCQKTENTGMNVPENNKSDNVELTVNVVDGSGTKATGSFDSGEKTVSSIQVFCFDKSTGVREDYGSSTGTSLNLSVSTGTKRIIALANCPSLSSVMSETDLLASVSQFSNNSLSSFEMISPTDSGADKTISATGSVDISVKRIVAKVLIDKISASFTSEGLRSADFIIDKIYLGNVAKTNNYGLSLTPSEFYSGASDNGEAVNGLIRETGLSINLKNSGTHTTKHGFYVYPNSSSSKTAVFLEGTILGKSQMYSFELPDILHNKVYEVTNITITKLSGELADVTFNISVADWESDTWSDGFLF